jgi:hypothetical protein
MCKDEYVALQELFNYAKIMLICGQGLKPLAEFLGVSSISKVENAISDPCIGELRYDNSVVVFGYATSCVEDVAFRNWMHGIEEFYDGETVHFIIIKRHEKVYSSYTTVQKKNDIKYKTIKDFYKLMIDIIPTSCHLQCDVLFRLGTVAALIPGSSS